MRSLLMSLLAFRFTGHGTAEAGRSRAVIRTTKTTAKTATATAV